MFPTDKDCTCEYKTPSYEQIDKSYKYIYMF